MAKKTEQVKPAEGGAEGPVWLVWGGDEFMVSRHARELVNGLCPPDQQALGLEIVEGRVEVVDAAVAALRKCRAAVNTVGFFGASKTVWLREASFFYESIVGRSAAVKEESAKLADDIKRGLMAGQKLVISASKVDRRSAFYKACQAGATVREFAVPEKPHEREKYAREVIRHLLDEAGLRASAVAIEALLGKAGADSRQLHIEMEKLRTYLGARKEITEQDVRLMVSPARETAAWDLADAMGERDLAKALDVLRQLIFQGETAFRLIMGLQSRVRELIVFRTCLDQRWLRVSGENPWYRAEWLGAGEAEPLFADLPDTLHPAKLNPFRAGRLGAQANRYQRAELVRAQQTLLDMHERMISAGAPHSLLLELGLITIIGKQRHAA